MKRTYMYDNAIIHITIPDGLSKNIRRATEQFLHKVIKEKSQNGNTNKSRII